MSRTNMDAAALAQSLRSMAGDGSMEWVHEPMRASVLLEIADALDENDKLQEDLEFERSENGWAREFLNRMGPQCGTKDCPSLVAYVNKLETENAKLRELVVRMARALNIGDDWCHRECLEEFGCKYICRIANAMQELGIAEVVE